MRIFRINFCNSQNAFLGNAYENLIFNQVSNTYLHDRYIFDRKRDPCCVPN